MTQSKKKELDLNVIAKLEQLIGKKYGKEAIKNPRQDWSEEKEEEYQKQSKELYKKQKSYEDDSEKIEKDGFSVSKKLFTKSSNRTCPTCDVYSWKSDDDLYMIKYGCCKKCYHKYIDCPGGIEEWGKKREELIKEKSRK